MMLDIKVGTDIPILRTKSDPVTVFDDALLETIREMKETMLAPQDGGVTGVGLAANQVNINKRLFLVLFHAQNEKKQKVVVFINPEILEYSEAKVTLEEGCLSLPGVHGMVSRPKKIKVRWQNEKGNWCETKLDGWEARIFLHEYDHIEGILFTDHLKPEVRKKALQSLVVPEPFL